MATPIDCRAYYIDRDVNLGCYVRAAKSSEPFCQNFDNSNGNVGHGFSVSKYLIDRDDQNTPRSANLRLDHVCVVDNLADVARNGAQDTAAATESIVRTCGGVRPRSARARLRRMVHRVESLLRDMKAAARDVRNNVHQQITSGSTDCDNTTVLENRTSISGYPKYSRSKVTGGNVSDTELSRDWNQRRKSTSVVIDSALNNVTELLPQTQERSMSSADSNNNSRVYNASTANNSTTSQLLCRLPASGKTTSARNRLQTRRMVTQTTQTTRHSASQSVTVDEVATTCVRCAVATPRDEEVPTTGSDQSNYSGVYERDLDEILESVAKVSCVRLRRRRHNTATFRSAHQRADKFYFRLPCSPEVQSYRSSSDSCCERPDSDSESEGEWTSEDELDSDEDRTPAFDSRSFFRRLNRFLLNGNLGPEMAVIQP